MKFKKLTNYLLGSILVLSVFFGALELATRFISLVSGKGFFLSLHEHLAGDSDIKHIYQWHPFVGITFRPDNSFRGSYPHQKKHPKIVVDQHGFLSDGRLLQYDKKDNEIRIATIGASTTASLNLAYEENWPGYLGSLVQKSLPHKNVRIINAGIPGIDTAQSVVNLALRVMPFNPDIIIIYHGYNDLKAIRHSPPFKPDYSHIHRKPYSPVKNRNIFQQCLNHSMPYVRIRNEYNKKMREKSVIDSMNTLISGEARLNAIPKEAADTFEQHMLSLISIAESGNAKVILSSFATLHDTRSSFTRIHESEETSNLQKSELFLIGYFISGLTIEGVFKGINQYNQILKKIALERHTGWVDNAARIPHQDRYFVDRVHFSREGAALMAHNFFPVVLQELKKL